jgi:hypothetical protein
MMGSSASCKGEEGKMRRGEDEKRGRWELGK